MNYVLKILIAAAFFNGLLWITVIPVWQYPDEQSHFAQVQNVAENLLPKVENKYNTSREVVQTENFLGTNRDSSGNNKYTYHPEYKQQYSNNLYGPEEKNIRSMTVDDRKNLVKWEATENPPAYYSLAGFFYRLDYNGSIFERVYAIRLLSLLLFMVNVFVCYKISLLIFAREQTPSIMLTALFAFMPMLVFASTGILPDPLTNVLFAIMIYLSLKILDKDFRIKHFLILIFVFLIGIYTRQQFLISSSFIVIVLLIKIVKSGIHKNPLKLAAIFLLIFVPWYFLRSKVVEIGSVNLLFLTSSDFYTYSWWTIRHTYEQTLPWYWGVYKWLSYTLPHIYYEVINRVLLTSVIGVILKLVSSAKKGEIFTRELQLVFLIIISGVYFFFFALGDYFFAKQYGYTFGIQGRYYFPLIIAHLAIISTGILYLSTLLFKSYAKYVVLVVVLMMIVFNDLSLFHVALSYYDDGSISTLIKQVSQYKPTVLKGNILIILATIVFCLQALFLYTFSKSLISSNESN